MQTTELFVRYLLAALAVQYREQGLERSVRQVDKSYDFVVVGGGAAGLVVASRLTENPNVRVLVLESGGSGSQYSDSPVTGNEAKGSILLKSYQSVPSKACGNQPCGGGVANVLGGGSTVNDMIFVRGNKLDFDGWAAGGATGWSYEDVLPYFKKLESAEADIGTDKYRGRSGPVNVLSNFGQKYSFSDLTQRWLDAAKILNYSSGDYNGQTQSGFFATQSNVRSGRRQSMDNAYIRPFEAERKNLNILMFAFVTKVLFSGKNAVGVEYTRFNKTYTVSASREVILSAGAMRTPQLLMVSGVGPREQLEQFKIPIVAELPGVGKGLQNHAASSLQYFIDVNSTNVLARDEENYCRWLKNGSGVFGSSYVIGLGFLRTYNSKSSDDVLAQALTFINYVNGDPNQMTAICWLTQQRSSGTLNLTSSDATVDPAFDFNFVAVDKDKEDLVECLKTLKKVFDAKPFSDVRAKLIGPIVQECSQYAFGSDEYFKCTIDHRVGGAAHPCCTSKMGRSSDPLAVVDTDLRVLGVKNLRVIDASVMPTITRGNTLAPTLMIAEKGVDVIKKQLKLFN